MPQKPLSLERCALLKKPFTGIGSEGYSALKCGRKFIGTELKPEYYRQAIKNINEAASNSSILNLDAKYA